MSQPPSTTRTLQRVCPYCGEEGMILWMGGYTGTVYKCPHCQYIGPIMIEDVTEDVAGDAIDDEGPSTVEETRQSSSELSRINNILNWAGLLFGLSFMAIGLVVGFSPLPLGEGSVAAYGLGVFALGVVLVIVSGLFWVIDKSRHTNKGS